MDMKEQDRRATAETGELYSLRFESGNAGQAERIDFAADDAYQALVIARRESGGRPAELWRGEIRLSTISEISDSFWEIRPSPAKR